MDLSLGSLIWVQSVDLSFQLVELKLDVRGGRPCG